MSDKARAVFYTACVATWALVCFFPAMGQKMEEQDRLDDAFYAKLDVPDPVLLNKQVLEVYEQMPKANTWEEYASLLRRHRQLELFLPKYSKTPWRYDENMGEIKQAEHVLSMTRTRITQKVNELGQRSRDNDPSVGARPEDGIQGMPDSPELASMAHYWPAVWGSWIFAFLILAVRLDAHGFSIWKELVPWRLPLATLCWPVGLLKYPTGEPAEQLARGLRFATLAIVGALSMSPAVASAQTKAGKDGKKKSSPFAFTIETRNVRVVGPDPDPNLVVKSTLTTPQGWVAQSTFVKAEDSWATTNLVGRVAHNEGGVRVDVVGGLSQNSAGTVVLPVGVVASVNRARWLTAFPFAGYERRLDKPANHVTAANQTLLKIGDWRVGAETFVKKVPGTRTQWYAGPVVARTVGKKWYTELIGYCNQVGEWRIRGRFSFAHTW